MTGVLRSCGDKDTDSQGGNTVETQDEDTIYKLRREALEEARPAHNVDLELLAS